jgi:flagellar hook-associated protein 3 FlgL
MRVSSNTVSDGIVRQIQQLSSQQAKLQNQVGTGLRISQPEDDPAAVGRVLNLQSERSQLTQFGLNASRALELAQASASGLQGIKKISDRAGELATLGSGAIGTSAMTGYGAETTQLVEQALQLANTRFNGDYLYAGSKLDSPPFTALRDLTGKITSISYNGDTVQPSIPISEASSITPTTDGATNNGIADFLNNLVSLRDALTSGSSSGVTTAHASLATSEDLLVSTIADNGGVQTRIEASQSQQTDRTTSLDTLISGETDADLPSTIVKLSQTQTAYQAALSSAAKIMSQSLLDYLK